MSKFLICGRVATNKTLHYFDRGSMAVWPQPQNISSIFIDQVYIDGSCSGDPINCSLVSPINKQMQSDSVSDIYERCYNLKYFCQLVIFTELCLYM